MSSFDPLEGIEGRTPREQMAMLIQATRMNARGNVETRDELKQMKRALWGLILTILAGIIIFLVTFSAGGRPSKSNAPAPRASVAAAVRP